MLTLPIGRESTVRRRPARASRPRARLYLVVAIVLLGLNLRTLFPSLSVLLPGVVAAHHPSHEVLDVLTTVPVLLLGACAPLAPLLARRWGTERTLVAAALVLTAGLAVRGTGELSAMLVGTVATGAAIAVANVLLPALVKSEFPHRLGAMSGLCTAAMCASAALAAGLTHPVAALTGSWRLGLLVWSVPAAAAGLVLLPLLSRRPSVPRREVEPAPQLWRSRTAWHVTGFMVLQAMTSFSVFAWLVPILRQRGIGAGLAGGMTAACILLQVVGCLVAPTLAARCRDQRAVNALAAVLTAAGFTLAIVGPAPLVWLWVVLLGIGQGSLTALALAMIVFRTRDERSAARLSGMMQGVGYGVGSSGTLLVGALHGATGSFAPAAIMFAAVGVVAVRFGILAGRARFVA